MHLKYVTIKLIILLAMLCFSATSSSAGSGKTEKVMMRDGKVVVCGQQDIKGFASGAYDTVKKCNDDKKNLSDKAIQNAKDRCDTFCKDMECNPPTYPKTIKTTAACKQPAGKKVYGNAATASALTCKCTQ